MRIDIPATRLTLPAVEAKFPDLTARAAKAFEDVKAGIGGSVIFSVLGASFLLLGWRTAAFILLGLAVLGSPVWIYLFFRHRRATAATDAAYLYLEQARRGGDPQALIEADQALARAVREIEAMEREPEPARDLLRRRQA